MLLESLFVAAPRRRRIRQGFNAAATNRLTADWATSIVSADEEARRSLRKLRARSRQLWMNNDYAEGYLARLALNVVGPAGILPQMFILDRAPTKEEQKPPRDKFAEAMIEREFKKWAKDPGVTGDQSLRDLQRLAVETVARDGEIIVRKIKGYPNAHGFAIQMLEADYLDEDYSWDRLPNGNRIRMSVEVDRFWRPVAYHLLSDHPGDFTHSFGGRRFVRVPAAEVIHLFLRRRPQQTRGIPFMHTAMTRLNMLGGYEEAELVASRMASAKMGVYTEKEGEITGTDVEPEGGQAGEGALIEEFEPGLWQRLPPGVTADLIEPTHPTDAFAPFVKQMLRGAATGLHQSYPTFASDLEGVNFSSGRMGWLEERDFYRSLMSWFIERFCTQVFEAWLDMALLNVLPLPIGKFDKFNAPRWQTRGWPWVEPLKDTKANLEGIQGGIKTRREVLSEQGHDLEETFTQLAEEQQLAESLGLSFGAAPTDPAPEPEKPDEEEDDKEEKDT